MILGIGSDLANIDRIAATLARFGDRFRNRVFTSVEQAKAWYDSPLYQEATVHRLKGGNWRVMIVEGA